MFRIRIFAVTALCLSLFCLPVQAKTEGGPVSVRGSEKDGYTRLIFDCPSPPKYSAKTEAGSLVVSFLTPAKIESAGASLSTLPRVTGYEVLGLGEVKIGFSASSSVRHFVLGNRLVVDIKGPKEDPHAPPPSSPPEKDKGAAADGQEPDTKKEAREKATENGISSSTAPSSPSVPVSVSVPSSGAPALLPQLVQVTSTRSLGMAVFERFGFLWIVVDAPDYPMIPQLSEEAGMQTGLGKFERLPAEEGTAFRLKLPPGYVVRGEGEGLVWKIHLVPHAKTEKNSAQPVAFSRLSLPAAEGEAPVLGLIWPPSSVLRLVTLQDPEAEDKITVALVGRAGDFSGPYQSVAELDSLRAAIGAAFVAKTDDLEIRKGDKGGVEISRPGGLSLSEEKDILSLKAAKEAREPESAEVAPGGAPFTKAYDFIAWHMGDIGTLSENQRIIMSGLADQQDQRKAEDLLTLARLVLSFGQGPEALGYLDFALQLVPEMGENQEFLALRGAAAALSGKYTEAHKDLFRSVFDGISEIKYWRAFVLAGLEDWKQAGEVMPTEMGVLDTYTPEIKAPFALGLAGIALRAGNVTGAEEALAKISGQKSDLFPGYQAALSYLEGEVKRQRGDAPGAKESWTPLLTGPDDMYRAKAGLAMTVLEIEQKEMDRDKAIDRLEGLRYSWRGDELETGIGLRLGRLYLEKGELMKGLTLLKQAAGLSPDSRQAHEIKAEMAETFRKIFLTDALKKVSPMDAVALYDEFADLVPQGDDGDKLVRNLAERLVDADLLPRAAEMLERQVDHRLQEREGAAVAMRLASIRLLDSAPDKALESLAKAEGFLTAVPAEQAAPDRRQIALLRARALSDLKKTDEAFSTLSLEQQDRDVLRLRADIAWKSKRWQDAADALERLVTAEDVSSTRPPGEDKAHEILNWAVALYLADNRSVLANLRERYADAMAQTPLAKKFEVVTRPRQSALLSDRETIQSIVEETDVFKNFLESFKSDSIPVSPKRSEKDASGGGDTASSSQSESAPITLPQGNGNEDAAFKTDMVKTD